MVSHGSGSVSRALGVACVVLGLLTTAWTAAGTASSGHPARLPEAVAAARLAPAPALAPARSYAGSYVVARGALRTRFARPVVLQRRTPRRLGRRHGLADDGARRLPVPVPGPRRRHLLPRVRRAGEGAREETSGAGDRGFPPDDRSPSRAAQALAQPAAAGHRDRRPAPGRGAHGGAGAHRTQVLLEQQVAGEWREVATAAQDSAGRARVVVPTDRLGLGAGTFRARMNAAGPDPAMTSAPATIRVRQAGSIVSPAAGATLTEEFPVRVKVDAAVPVTRISLFVDGIALPDPVAGAASTWETKVDPAALNLKRKHVSLVAVIRTARGRDSRPPCR